MEKILLSNPTNGNLSLKDCAGRSCLLPRISSSSVRVCKVPCLSSRKCLGFREVRSRAGVSSKLGLGTGLGHSVRAGGFRDSSWRKKISLAASGEESLFILVPLQRRGQTGCLLYHQASTELQFEGIVAEDGKDSSSVQESTTWKEERDESQKLEAESFETSRNSMEELRRKVHKTESLADESQTIELESLRNSVEESQRKVDKAAESLSEPRKGAKIHDFCLGIPYGGLLFGGGLISFLISHSKVSIIFGLLLGGAVLGLSTTSLKVWRQGKSCTPFILGQAVLSFILLARQLQEFVLTKNIFPTGCIAFISAVMLSFYSYVYAAGGNPPSKKLRSSSASQVS